VLSVVVFYKKDGLRPNSCACHLWGKGLKVGLDASLELAYEEKDAERWGSVKENQGDTSR
jgi:hypothetical protein